MTKCYIDNIDNESDNHILVTKGININIKNLQKKMTMGKNKAYKSNLRIIAFIKKHRILALVIKNVLRKIFFIIISTQHQIHFILRAPCITL